MSDQTELYRHFDKDGRLLYVGIAMTTVKRASQHRSSSPWWPEVCTITIERFSTRVEAAAAERRAIEAEKPVHNKTCREPERIPTGPDYAALERHLAGMAARRSRKRKVES